MGRGDLDVKPMAMTYMVSELWKLQQVTVDRAVHCGVQISSGEASNQHGLLRKCMAESGCPWLSSMQQVVTRPLSHCRLVSPSDCRECRSDGPRCFTTATQKRCLFQWEASTRWPRTAFVDAKLLFLILGAGPRMQSKNRPGCSNAAPGPISSLMRI